MHLKEDVPVVTFKDLAEGKDLTQQIHDAFGPEGMGIIAVSGVPDLDTLRKNLLPQAHKFAYLPEETKANYVLDDAFYAFGWSHGKEKFHGKPDYSKGSYYNNPVYNRPVEDEELIKKYPTFVHPNIWPTEEMPQLESAFMSLGQRMVDVGLLIAKQCDTYVSGRCPSYEPKKLHRIISTSRCCKARLLHYFSFNEEELKEKVDEGGDDLETQFSKWCGWHNDHGSLTGLVQAIYMDDNGNEVKNPDENAGLYVKTRSGKIIKANLPSGHLIFQIGETAQIHSGGYLQATPHAVNGPKCSGLNRETFAVFMEPDWDEPMSVPKGMKPESAGVTRNLPIGLPPLNTRWNNSQDFGQFSENTYQAYAN
jgi:isopenicillin N synthase-like dioxygenase